MSYLTLITTLIEKLNQPTSIAVMASAGVHAAVALTLPQTGGFLSGQSQPPQMVQLVSLTPGDQSRIPELSVPPIPATIYQQTPLPSPYPPLDRLPIPKPSAIATPKSATAKGLPTKTNQQFVSKLPVPKSTLRPDSRFFKRNPQLTPPRRTENVAGLGVVNPPNNNIKIPQKPRSNNIPIFNPNPEPSGIFPVQERDPLPTPPNINPPENSPFESNNGRLIAALGDRSGQRGINVTPDLNNTTNDQARRNAVEWLSRNNQTQYGSLEITGNYPKDACAKNLKGTTSLGIVVGVDGKPITEPQVLRSAGYPIFDLQAKQDVQSRSFDNQTGQQKLYVVNVVFDYKEEVCQAINRTTSPGVNPTKPEVNMPIIPPSANQNKPETPTPIPSPAANQNKPETPNPTPSPAANQNKPETPNPTPSPAANQNKPETPNPTPSPAANRIKPEESVSGQPQALDMSGN